MLQVQIRNWHCWKVTCICAVVAREGNDVVKIDMCHHGWGKTFVTITTNKGNISTGAMVQQDKLGNTYVVSTFIAIIRYFKHTLTCIIYIFKNKPHEHRKQTDLFLQVRAINSFTKPKETPFTCNCGFNL